MCRMAEPLIRLDPGGHAPLLRYDVPEPTSYSGRNLIEIELAAEDFEPIASEVPDLPPVPPTLPGGIRPQIEEAMALGFSDSRFFARRAPLTGDVTIERGDTPRVVSRSSVGIAPRLATLTAEDVESAAGRGMRTVLYRSMFGTLTHTFVPKPKVVRPRLYIVETYRLSSFLGDYGAGRILKTFTMLPGEKTKISIKTFLKSESDRKQASSVLDSFTQESADDFEQSIQSEQSDKQEYSETFEYHAEAEAEASWGWGSAKASAGVKGGTNSAREEFAKNVSSATQKHAAKASAKRDVQVNTSFEVTTTEQEETAIERELSNINLSRTLNFVFRQMNQEFYTLLHLVDVRVGFFNGWAESRKEVTLPQLDSLLETYIVQGQRSAVRARIVGALQHVLDYQDQEVSVVETRDLDGGRPYERMRRDLATTYTDPLGTFEVKVPGIVVSAMKNVMRTEGVIVEALLGEGDSLDAYARQLQELEVRRRRAEVERSELVNTVASAGDAAKAQALAAMTCPCGGAAASSSSPAPAPQPSPSPTP